MGTRMDEGGMRRVRVKYGAGAWFGRGAVVDATQGGSVSEGTSTLRRVCENAVIDVHFVGREVEDCADKKVSLLK
jgi:hypothetical protein